MTAKSPAVSFLPCLSAVRCLELSSQRGATSRYFCQKTCPREKIFLGIFFLYEILSFRSVKSRDVTCWC